MTGDSNSQKCAEFQAHLPELIASGEDISAHPHLQSCPLCLQQPPQRFSISLPGLFQQIIREMALLHRGTPKDGRGCKSFETRIQKPTGDRARHGERNRKPSPSTLKK